MRGPTQLAQLIRHFRLWLATGACKIKNRQGKLVALAPNAYQRRIVDRMEAQALAGLPIKIILLKCRKGGATTLIEAFFYFLAKEVDHWFAETVAHSRDSTDEIFNITRRIFRNDPDQAKKKTPSKKRIDFPERDSAYRTETAGGQFIGSGATIQAFHGSELAKWPGDPAAVQDQLSSLLNAMPEDPNTVTIIESTANMNDLSGEFERMAREALAGTSGFELVFGAWFDEESYVADASKLGVLSEYEKGLVERFGLIPEQIAFRRKVKAEKCGGREDYTCQEYPSTPEEAFQVAQGKIYPMLREHHQQRRDTYPINTTFYRGIDWGGAHPFVCVWLAHIPGPPGFSIDAGVCPNTWLQFTTWKRDAAGRPQRLGDDAPDACRYPVMEHHLWGHVHVFRELFVKDSAAKGQSPLDMAKQIKEMTLLSEPIQITVADRSQPGNILLFCQQGIPTIAATRPQTVKLGEVEDGISRLQALMLATVPLVYEPPALSGVRLARRIRARSQFHFVESDLRTRLEITRPTSGDSAGATHPQLGKCW